MSDTPRTDADTYETAEALLCEMQGLRDELVDAKFDRDNLQDQRDCSLAIIEQLKAEGDEARDTATRLNRRLTKAEGIIEAAHLVDNRPTKGGGLGRSLANYAADKYMRERDEARKERDEAIADRDRARLSALDSDRAHDRMVGELEKAYRERDEAREERDRYKRMWDESRMETVEAAK